MTFEPNLNPVLYDRLGRGMSDLRISVTDKCNLRCSYCMPPEKFGHRYRFADSEQILSFDEIVRVARLFVGLGVSKIRLTGGEPLLRKNVVGLVARLTKLKGLQDLTLTTNATLLTRHAHDLRRAGLKRLNISLDAAEKGSFKLISNRDHLDKVLEGIETAREAGFRPLKINAVVCKSANQDQIVGLARLFKGTGDILRFIEFMDVGTLNKWDLGEVVGMDAIGTVLKAHFELEQIDGLDGVARYWRHRDSGDLVGVIASVTKPFCKTCTRIRITAEGNLLTCLFATSGTDLKTPLRKGMDDAELKRLITSCWQTRTDRYSELRQQTTHGENGRVKTEMYQIGG